MNFQKIMFYLCVALIVYYVLQKSKYPAIHSNYFIFECIVVLGIFFATWGELYLKVTNKGKILAIVNLIAALLLLGYGGFVFAKQIYIIDKINFILIGAFILVSLFQSIKVLRETKSEKR